MCAITVENERYVSNCNSLNNTISPFVILMIDDEETCIISVQLMLLSLASSFAILGDERKSKEYSFVTFTNGTDGLDYLRGNASDVAIVLLDLMMPGIYGLDVLDAIRNEEKLKHLPVILQSGIANEGDIERARQIGVEGVIRKPYTKETVLSQIVKVIL